MTVPLDKHIIHTRRTVSVHMFKNNIKCEEYEQSSVSSANPFNPVCCKRNLKTPSATSPLPERLIKVLTFQKFVFAFDL